jgi:hypothetical protein
MHNSRQRTNTKQQLKIFRKDIQRNIIIKAHENSKKKTNKIVLKQLIIDNKQLPLDHTLLDTHGHIVAYKKFKN